MKYKHIVLLMLLISFMISLAPQIDLAKIEAKAIDNGLLPNITNIKPDISDSFVSPSQMATKTYRW